MRFTKKNEIFKIGLQLDRPVQGENYETFQRKIRQVTDEYEHFGARFLRLYSKDKKLDFAVDLLKLDQKGMLFIKWGAPSRWSFGPNSASDILFRILFLAVYYARNQAKRA